MADAAPGRRCAARAVRRRRDAGGADGGDPGAPSCPRTILSSRTSRQYPGPTRARSTSWGRTMSGATCLPDDLGHRISAAGRPSVPWPSRCGRRAPWPVGGLRGGPDRWPGDAPHGRRALVSTAGAGAGARKPCSVRGSGASSLHWGRIHSHLRPLDAGPGACQFTLARYVEAARRAREDATPAGWRTRLPSRLSRTSTGPIVIQSVPERGRSPFWPRPSVLPRAGGPPPEASWGSMIRCRPRLPPAGASDRSSARRALCSSHRVRIELNDRDCGAPHALDPRLRA